MGGKYCMHERCEVMVAEASIRGATRKHLQHIVVEGILQGRLVEHDRIMGVIPSMMLSNLLL
jgi:hypothetical protein